MDKFILGFGCGLVLAMGIHLWLWRAVRREIRRIGDEHDRSVRKFQVSSFKS